MQRGAGRKRKKLLFLAFVSPIFFGSKTTAGCCNPPLLVQCRVKGDLGENNSKFFEFDSKVWFQCESLFVWIRILLRASDPNKHLHLRFFSLFSGSVCFITPCEAEASSRTSEDVVAGGFVCIVPLFGFLKQVAGLSKHVLHRQGRRCLDESVFRRFTKPSDRSLSRRRGNTKRDSRTLLCISQQRSTVDSTTQRNRQP